MVKIINNLWIKLQTVWHGYCHFAFSPFVSEAYVLRTYNKVPIVLFKLDARTHKKKIVNEHLQRHMTLLAIKKKGNKIMTCI